MTEPKHPTPRDTLSRLGEHDLDDAALARIADRISKDGPGVVRRAKQLRVAVRTVPLGLAAGMALIWASTPAPRSETPTLLAAAKACESWSAPAQAVFAGRVDLGRRGEGRISADAELSPVLLDECQIVLRLTRGEIAIHAKDLGGGTLIVETPQGQARVVGTIFSVALRNGQLAVEVAEGTVAVETDDERVSLESGRRAETSGGRLVMRELSTKEREAVKDRARVGITVASTPEAEERAASPEAPERPELRAKRPPRVRAPDRDTHPSPGASTVETAEELVARAGRLRAKDPGAARLLYEEAGAMPGATAEAAWIALARMELSDRRRSAALTALDERDRRFPDGSMRLEAAGIRLETLEGMGRAKEATRWAKEILARWPDSQQARKAQETLERSER